MAEHYYRINKGAGLDPNAVVLAGSSGADMDFRLRDGVGHTRMTVLLTLQKLKAYFQQNNQVSP